MRSQVLSYAGGDSSITVPVALRSGALFADLVASIDTGASHCLFENAYAIRLGLDLTSGVLTIFQTANSIFDAYGHEVEIDVLGIVTHSLVYFFVEPSIRRPGRLVGSRPLGLDELYLAEHGHERSVRSVGAKV